MTQLCLFDALAGRAQNLDYVVEVSPVLSRMWHLCDEMIRLALLHMQE